jgi:hypothetical protein
MEHLAEGLASLISQVQSLTELCSSRPIDSANVFNVGVDTRSKGSAHGQRRDATGRRYAGNAKNVDQQQFTTDSEEHSSGGDSENADRWVVRAGSSNQLDHNEEPTNRKIPVEPVELIVSDELDSVVQSILT